MRRAGETQSAMSLRVCVEDSGVDRGAPTTRFAQHDLGAGPRSFARAEHHPPIVGGIFFEQQNFKLPARPRIDSAEPSRNYARVVVREDVARLKIVKQIAKPAVFAGAPGRMPHYTA